MLVESPHVRESSPEFHVPKPVKCKKRCPAKSLDSSEKKVTVKKTFDITKDKQIVLDYMKSQNRPYSSQNIFDNLHGVISRAQLEAILSELSMQENYNTASLICKDYGKSKVYLIHQEVFRNVNDQDKEVSTEDLQKVEDDIKSIQSEISALETQLSECKDYWSSYDVASLGLLLEKEEKEVNENMIELAQLNEEREEMSDEDQELLQLSVEEIEELEMLAENELRQSKKRKLKCYELIDVVSECLNISVSDAVELLDLELDPDPMVTEPLD
ncbi:homologous-pairing protein 2 homolog isoform X1 [Hylaeus volcanicus]|uniref:homologous-pairing protein 2 homolog isoform X1 n=1 Tax=Hylaeus volcanicus TaxID=313075 RepID=UPI0023B78FEB|nr:homologous-pairing protein 2 homolog isoform X1 [Hylaeus volcanicus]XP_053991301.1 homologous-pairing protein 2 homolog isoform X1 [Hylaeus volcanicus]XP_053991302.1 homologous-pairing protein 2 homolog isoform X1 [Hylaeus volcanicus]XP_053991303.1 homologous-pairing protein 2 homolog isoform X1 [Hylaeus volcanicus]XP_053991304.1 homologous-pairing protein 2 homolog isoform X1 [Hylaeus volcanicus]XP_053991305.1 homologous-pairing protein 2 homolog isoform X1 [Hylaeus volcanicus]XP_05399130